jgi:glutamyl-tRNA(Gln) amidotransferase subunit D
MAELNFNAGDEVNLRLAKEEVRGVVIESSDNSIVLLKLENGYNVGIAKENILASRVVRKYNESETGEFKIEKKKGLPSIGLIITGGTIASRVDYKTGGVKPITNVNDFVSYYPELLDIVNVKRLEVPFKIFSENMTSENWIKLAESVKSMLDDSEIKGVVISHGTDTLHYTSAALSFFL